MDSPSDDAGSTARQVLEGYEIPSIGRSLGELRAVQGFRELPEGIELDLALPVPVGGMAEGIRSALQGRLQDRGLTKPLSVSLTAVIRPRAVQKPLKPMVGIHNIVVVASGKGGVGKSTVAVNLALAWAAAGARVGLLDADIYGPSQPLMLGVGSARPTTLENKRIVPIDVQGLKLMSIGLLIDPDQPAVWRGPMVTQALTQLLNETQWGELDFLVIDMPPGTGDLQLTLAQRVPVAGAVIVTTPQQVAVADARKGLKMFEKVGVSVLGIVENMATHTCSACGHEDAVFGEGGGEALAREAGLPLLGRLPLDARIRGETDSGRPSAIGAADAPRGRAFHELARQVAGSLARRPPDRSAMFGNVVVEERR